MRNTLLKASLSPLLLIFVIGCADRSFNPDSVSTNTASPDSLESVPAEPEVDRLKFADTISPAGNVETLRFLEWAKQRHGICTMMIDSDGACVEMSINVCSEVTDGDVERVSKLKRIESLSFEAPTLTDAGLKHLETMPALKHLNITHPKQITDDGVERLISKQPNLILTLPGRDAG